MTTEISDEVQAESAPPERHPIDLSGPPPIQNMGLWRRFCYWFGYLYFEVAGVYLWPDENEWQVHLFKVNTCTWNRAMFKLRLAEEWTGPHHDPMQWRITITLLFFITIRFSIE